ncbi:DUF4956 domain-containing protein [Gammaproteobacteria bacterium]|nr:DUF4956 domain-containing protein [Gammaproteobacteria bacterium]
MLNTLIQLINNSAYNILVVLILIFSGFFIRLLLEASGQTWVKTKAHTATLIILPIITYVITNVISGNIALSLGMVGALSIVRFRNPVRSPLELSAYFGAITMGISASVSLKWLIFLVVSVVLVVLFLIVASIVSTKIFKRPLFISSFTEGNSLSILTIRTLQKLDICEKHEMLQSKNKNENEIIYSFASDNFLDLRKLEEEPDIQSNSISVELRR